MARPDDVYRAGVGDVFCEPLVLALPDRIIPQHACRAETVTFLIPIRLADTNIYNVGAWGLYCTYSG